MYNIHIYYLASTYPRMPEDSEKQNSMFCNQGRLVVVFGTVHIMGAG
jgi:hypothetical protein